MPVARGDRATTTWTLSNYLDSMNVGWTLGAGKALAWPPCVRRVKGVTELLGYLNSTAYAAGCAPEAQYLAHPAGVDAIYNAQTVDVTSCACGACVLTAAHLIIEFT